MLLSLWHERRVSLVQTVEVIPQDVAEAAEFSRTLVVKAELESLGCSHSIQRLQLHIAAQDIQDSPIGFPQKFEPGSH